MIKMTDKEKIQSRLRNITPEKLKELSDEQAEFIVSPINQSIYLKACPGSGKTEVVGLKSAYEIADWKEKYSGLAILSFTRNAAKEIANRISKYNGINSTKHPHFVGTIDSWLHKYIFHPFGHKIVNFGGKNHDKSFHLVENGRFDFLLPFQTLYYSEKGNPSFIQVNDYYYNYGKNLESNNYDLSGFDSWLVNNLKEAKDKFLKVGYATYQDAEFICYFVLKDNKNILENFVNRFPVIIIDECQDLSYSQLYIFHVLHKAGVKLFFIGDLNQAIYEFRKVYIENIERFISTNKFLTKELSKNYRSNQQIVDVCTNLEKSIIKSKIVSRVIGDTSQDGNFIFLIEYDKIETLPKIFIDYIGEYNKKCKMGYEVNLNKSAILGRGHSLLSEIRSNLNYKLDKIELIANALNCWNIRNRTGDDMKNALQQFGKSISILAYDGKGNYQQQYCPEDISQLEWRRFLFELILEASDKLYPFGEITWSEWANKHLKLFLKDIWKKLPIKGKEWSKVEKRVQVKKTKNKKKKDGEIKFKDKKIIDTLNIISSDYSDKIRITTIHDVKGETLDAVMLVSSKDKQSKGGHYEHWISDLPENSEFVRFAYVASSRPKHLLIWAIPTIKKDKENILQKLNQVLNIKD